MQLLMSMEFPRRIKCRVTTTKHVCVSARAEDIISADRVILPGVGAFADGMRGLQENDLIEPINMFAQAGRPLLGICLGMQMLATCSCEFGDTNGLDLIKGDVVPVPDVDVNGVRLKSPHIGRASLYPSPTSSWSNTMMDNLPVGHFG